MLKGAKETMRKEIEEMRAKMSQQTENINKVTEIIKKEPNGNSEAASTIIDIKSSLEVFSNRTEQTEDAGNVNTGQLKISPLRSRKVAVPEGGGEGKG